MQTSTMSRFSWSADESIQHKLLWLTAVVLTMGMCLLTPKRVLADELREELLAKQPDVTLASNGPCLNQVPVKAVVKVTEVRHRPVWATTISGVAPMDDEYSVVRRRRDA